MKKPPYDEAAGDQLRRGHPDALRLAESRALDRGRQRVWRRVGRFTGVTWCVQDVR